MKSRGPGRPTKYSPDVKKEICNNIRLGLNQEDSANLSNVDVSTFHDWINRYPEFAEEVKRANLEKKQRCIAMIAKHQMTGWQPNAWWLERRFPEEFSLHQKVEHSGTISKLIITRPKR